MRRFKNIIKDQTDVLEVYRQVSFDNSIVSVTDKAGTILLANKNFCKISGFSKEELIGSNHQIVNSGFHTKEFFKEMWGTLLSGKTWQGEICNKSKDGGLYWVDTIITPIWNDETKEYQFISIRLEVTHRKRFEEVLTRIEDIASVGYWEWLVEPNTLFWSDQVYRIHGRDPESFKPEVSTAINHYAPEYQEVISNALEESLLTGDSYDLELQIITAKKKRLWVRVVGHVEFSNGKPFRAYGTFQDVDKRKRTRNELAKSQVQLQLAVESAGIGNWVYLPKEDKLTWDDASFDVFGVDKAKFRGSINDWLEVLAPETREESQKRFSQVLENKEEIYDSEFEIIHSVKGSRIVKGRAVINYNDQGEPVEIVGLNWDITKEREAEKILIDAREKAIEATRAKSAFLASMSHEIRTPMNGLMGTLELLGETKLNKEQKELLETIQMSGEQLLNVVNDILDFSKIEAGKLELEYRNFDLTRLLKGVNAIFEVQANKKGVGLKIELGSNTPKFIMGDDTRLKQVLTNLVSNALKFTSEGEIVISVESSGKDSDSDLRTLLFKVRDTGLGIPIEKQEALFDSFSQVDATTTRKFGGTGLGLAICKSLVNSMGGHIGVESFPNAGSVFYFQIMTQIGEDFSNENETPEVSSYRRDLRILLAEDNKVNQKLALSFLGKLGFTKEQVFVAENGKKAVEMVLESLENANPFDCVLMDMQMPEMDGVETTQEIINKVGENAPLIIAMTANVFEEDKKRCLDAGMTDFATKPIKKSVLIQLFNKYFLDPNYNELYSENAVSMPNYNYNYIDPDKILYEFGEDFDIFEELVQDFKDQASDFAETIKKGVADGDAKAVQVAGHTLKGIVGNFYANKLKDTAFAIEQAGNSGDLSEVEEKLGIFLSLNELVCKELDHLLESHSESSQAA